MGKPEYKIILFYNYTHIEDPEQLKYEQRSLCERLGMTGRTIIAHEGINATLEGTTEAVNEYWNIFTSDPRFKNTHLKISDGDGNSFPKLSIKVRPEIVSLHLGEEHDINPNTTTGTHLDPEELHEWFEKNEDFVIIDMRNDYEHKVGHFEGSILPPMKSFRELPENMKEIEQYKDKKVLSVCTGGIRCEKASGYLVENGFKDVYQLNGGIVSYMEKYPNKHFKGKLYVFDGRITMGFETDSPEHEVIGTCHACNLACDTYGDCANLRCHRHLIMCENCRESDGTVFCSAECKEKVAVHGIN